MPSSLQFASVQQQLVLDISTFNLQGNPGMDLERTYQGLLRWEPTLPLADVFSKQAQINIPNRAT